MRIGSQFNFRFGLLSLQRHQDEKDLALERLATGKRINRASDDPSGMMAADELRFDMTKLERFIENTEYAMASAGAKEGALSVVSDQLVHLQGLVVAGANRGASTISDREALQVEADAIIQNLQRMENTTTFRGQQILRDLGVSSLGATSTRGAPEDGADGSTPGEPTFHSILSLRSGGALNLVDGDSELAQRVVDAAVDAVANQRASLGAHVQSLESKANVWRKELIEVTDAHSQIVDADYAKETSRLVREQLLEQATLSAIEISRENAERALILLESAAGTSSRVDRDGV